MLAAADLNPGKPPEEVIADFWGMLRTLEESSGDRPRGKIKAFAEERVTGVLANLKELDAKLDAILVVSGWEMQRLGTVERAVLRAGAWELSNTDIPHGVVINEAIDIVNWFSSPRSCSLVNGVLDKYAKSL
jgi:N utilization substance protein B